MNQTTTKVGAGYVVTVELVKGPYTYRGQAFDRVLKRAEAKAHQLLTDLMAEVNG